MKKIALLIIGIALCSILFISGCAEQSPIKNQEEVSQAVTDISTNIDDVASTLQDIDRTLGGT